MIPKLIWRHLGGVAPRAVKSEGDKLWEDNWDDVDIEKEFSVQR